MNFQNRPWFYDHIEKLFNEIAIHTDILTDWEETFYFSLLNDYKNGNFITKKQLRKLEEIHEAIQKRIETEAKND